jgi:hypothetical protein
MKRKRLPTVLRASENFASKRLRISGSLEARWQPMESATLMMSASTLLMRTKNTTLMSARMLSWQIRPFLPVRSISMRLTEISINSERWMIGTTKPPLRITLVRVAAGADERPAFLDLAVAGEQQIEKPESDEDDDASQ